jgi:hypothetical protein
MSVCRGGLRPVIHGPTFDKNDGNFLPRRAIRRPECCLHRLPVVQAHPHYPTPMYGHNLARMLALDSEVMQDPFVVGMGLLLAFVQVPGTAPVWSTSATATSTLRRCQVAARMDQDTAGHHPTLRADDSLAAR